MPRFVHCIQNHDQVGNRALGERLQHLIELDAYRAASALLLLCPATPLLFMGQEWAASTPFLLFTDHNAELGRLVTDGRRAEFAGFTAFSGELVPDPQARATFERSKLRWDERLHAAARRHPTALPRPDRSAPPPPGAARAWPRTRSAVLALGESALALRRHGPTPQDTLLMIVNLRDPLRLDLTARAATTAPAGLRWVPLLDSRGRALWRAGRGAAE